MKREVQTFLHIIALYTTLQHLKKRDLIKLIFIAEDHKLEKSSQELRAESEIEETRKIAR